MARAERVRRRPRAETRQALLDAAARVFAERGFHGASVEAVAEEAGFSTGALYSNFDGKEALFLALYEERIRRRRRELTEAVEGAGGRGPGLASAAGDVAEVFQRERDWFLLYFEFVLHAARNPRFARRFESLRNDGLRELADGIARGLADAGIEPSMDPEDLARAVSALAYGLAVDRLVNRRRKPDELFAQALDALFRGIAHGRTPGSR